MFANETALNRIGDVHTKPKARVVQLRPMSEKDYASVLGVERHLPVVVMGQEEAFRIIDATGKDVIFELFALGQLPIEIALRLGVPKRHFTEWMRLAFTVDERSDLARHHAEACIYRAQMLLTAPVYDRTEAAQLRALSALLVRAAEGIEPAQWAPRSRRSDAAVLPSVSPPAPPMDAPVSPNAGVTLNISYGGPTAEDHAAYNNQMMARAGQNGKIIDSRKAADDLQPLRSVEDIFGGEGSR